jgi:PKD repeat protein
MVKRKEQLNQSSLLQGKKGVSANRIEVDTQSAPLLGLNFRGNARGSGVPMDNTMAISHNGHIVSAINSNVIFTQPDGRITYNKGFSDFFTLLGLGTRMYDPRVIYDPVERKFIFMCLHGSEPATTYLCLAFSETEDPNGVWNYYALKGNPDGDDNWFDYPNIAISQHDFYLTGLMRNRDGDWQYSVMYQIDKLDGYKGDTLRYKYYNDISDADGEKSFNLVPVPSGWNTLLSPGMYFISNNPTGGNTYNLHYTTESLHNSPDLMAVQSLGYETSLAPDARQPGTEKRLNTFDSRIWSAMYLNGVIHMGSHVDTPEGDVGLFYGRMSVTDFVVHADVLKVPGEDFGFPSFAAFGNAASDSRILVNYLVSGTEKLASQEVRVCQGNANEFIWSSPTVVKEGRSVINVLTGDVDRWGDYTTSGRRFIDNRVEAWIAGCFGEMLSYGTWLGQLRSPDTLLNELFIDFVADKTTTPKDTEIQFTQLTQGENLKFRWSFEGGSPSESDVENPIVTYAEDGIYSVTLIVESSAHSDTMKKQDYIFIQDDEVPPSAAFSQDRDTVYSGEFVQFTNLSSPNSKTFRWTFVNGTPRSSQEVNPRIQYNRTGSHPVALSAFNIAGGDGLTVQRAVTVLPRQNPKAGIQSDKTQIASGESVQFFDTSTGGIVQRQWYFEGGVPETSQEEAPVVRYDEVGSYDVTLVVSNDLGTDSLVLTDYIQVGTSTTENSSYFSDIKLYPNPVSDESVALEFNLQSSGRLNFVLFDSRGNEVKTIFNDRVKKGANVLRFNVDNLPSGYYILKIHEADMVVRSLPFIKM